MNNNKKTNTLDDKHRDELHASGLTDERIAAANIYSAKDGDITKILGWKPKECSWGTGMVIPYPGDNGYSRVKLDFPRSGDDDKLIKYESPKKSMNRAYIPQPLVNDDKPKLITEGEKKTIKAVQEGFNCIGLSGVWSWQQKRLRDESGWGYGERRLIPDLDAIEWKNQEVYIVFDSDAATNTHVQQAEASLALALTNKKATVRIIRIPASGDDKVGLDDFLIAHGKDALQKLIDEARPAEKPESPGVMDWARLIIDDQFRTAEGLKIRWWKEEFFLWNGCKYSKYPTPDLDAGVFRWLDKRMRKVTPRLVTDVRKAIGALSIVPTHKVAPCWLNNQHETKPENIIAFRNKLLDITNIGGELSVINHTPDFFSEVCLDFDFLPDATCPKWEKFLSQVFDDDEDLIHLLRQWFGLLLTCDTSYQKILFIVGQPRSGKGTIYRIIEYVLGEAACVSPTLTSLGEPFGLSQLLGKTVCGFPDAQLSGRSAGTVEILKSISGEDSLSVNRKHLSHLPHVRMKTRIILVANELLRFNDTSGALEPRISLLPTQRTFVGKENLSLTDELQTEASGILNWGLRGLPDLHKNKRFINPEKSQAMMNTYRRSMSPVRAFVEDRCRTEPENPQGKLSVPCPVIYNDFVSWADDNGHSKMSSSTFGVKLRAACPGVERRRLRDENKNQFWAYTGISLV